MGYSKLASYVNLTDKKSSRNRRKIKKIVIHHWAGIVTAKQGVDYFKKTDRKVSSNYVIGKDGSIGVSVDEDYRAWTTGDYNIDSQAITIETSNNKLGDKLGVKGWTVSDESIDSLIKLIADICKRHGIDKCTYTGDKSGVLQMHKWYQNTACPGEFLSSKFKYISDEVNKVLTDEKPVKEEPKTTSIPKTNNKSYKVLINSNALNVRSTPSMQGKVNTVIRDKGLYTIVEEKNGWGKLKSGAGWVSLKFTTKLPTSSSVSVNNKVRVVGTRYATGQLIPDWVKKDTYTVSQIKGENSLLKEINSWVRTKDLKEV